MEGGLFGDGKQKNTVGVEKRVEPAPGARLADRRQEDLLRPLPNLMVVVIHAVGVKNAIPFG
jgi:hypothetical protein